MTTIINDTHSENHNLNENIKKEILNANLSNAILLLLEQIEKDEATRNLELKELNSEINNLKTKINSLENSNAILIKERNIKLVKEYSTALIRLIDNNKFEEFKYLIEKNDYPVNEFFSEDLPELSHMNLLHYCIDYHRENFAKYLIEDRMADVNVADREEKWTPIMYAVQKQMYNIIKLLIKYGATVDYKDEDGFSPLSVAVDSNNLDLVKLVLTGKPKIDKAKEIMAMAEPYKNEEIIETIQDYFGFQLILYDNENSIATTNTTPTYKLSNNSRGKLNL